MIMKKRLAALLACVLVVSALVACGEENGENGTETATLAEATITPTIEVVQTEETNLSALPVEEYVTLGDYKNLTVSVAPKAEVTDEEIETSVQSYFYSDASYLAAEDFLKEGTVKEGDVVLIDYEGKKGGVAFDGGTATDATLGIGSGQFIDGFEEGLVGVKAGETVDLNLTFPESYGNEELAGQAVVFTVTVKGIAALSDAIVAKLGIEDVTTVKEYKESIGEYLDYQNESTYYSNLTNAIYTALVENNTVSKIPSSIYEPQRDAIIQQISSEAAYYGIDGDTYTQMYTGMNLADYAVTAAESNAQLAVICQALANAEKLTVTDEEIDTFVADYVATYGAYYGIDSVENFYENNSKDDVRTVLLQEKVVDFMSNNAKIVDAE